MKRILTYCCLLLALATLLSCLREKAPVQLCDEGSTLEIHFSTVGLESTKATTPGDGDAADGGGIAATTADSSVPDLVILIANNIPEHEDYGKIVMAYPTTGSLESSFTANDTQTTVKFSFASKPAGDYIVYAFANTEGMWEMTTNGSDTYSGATLTSLTTAAQVEALYFKAQTRNTVGWEDPGYASTSPKYDEGLTVGDRLPLSAKTSLTVSPGKNGEAYLELIRCVAKVTALIINNTGEFMGLSEYKHTVHGINSTSGYVLPHEPDYTGTAGNLVANPDVKYGTPVEIPIWEDTSQEYDWYVFPSNGPYTICISFTLNKDSEDPLKPEKTYTYYNLPVTNWRAVNIPALQRNQHITVTTRISKGLTVSFNFEVSDWTQHTSSVVFL